MTNIFVVTFTFPCEVIEPVHFSAALGMGSMASVQTRVDLMDGTSDLTKCLRSLRGLDLGSVQILRTERHMAITPDRHWCGNVRWRRLYALHTCADHSEARLLRNRPPHRQSFGSHMFNKKVRRNKMNDRH